jgi:hypothetical protein
MPSEAFASVLSARRADYNAQFTAARRAAPELDDEAFKVFLAASLEPLVDAVAALDKSALIGVVDTAYGIGLELVSQRLAGPRARTPVLDQAFQRLFPVLASHIARAPEAVLPRLCNALHQLATVPGARPDDWCNALAGLAPNIERVEDLMGVGQILAWLSGLAHYRAGALALCRLLPAHLVLLAWGAVGADREALLGRFERDPWFVPSAPELGFRLVGSVGSFRGFGGSFLAPPQVARVGEQLFVVSGDDAWLLALDAFGCTFHRAGQHELSGARFDIERAGASVARNTVSAFGKSLTLPDTGPLTSAVGNASTLLVTTAHSYTVTVVAFEGA